MIKMICPHLHLRDWGEKEKETIKHGLWVAYNAGLDAVLEMPNTLPAMISKEHIMRRIRQADLYRKELGQEGIEIFHGLYAGITADPVQIEEVVKLHEKHFPRVAGLKMYAGHSTGNMGIISEDTQLNVYMTLAMLGYEGVLAVHCEKEKYIHNDPNKDDPLVAKVPVAHSLSRPPNSELMSVIDQINFAHEANYKGTLHICHVSVPETLKYIEKRRNSLGFRVTCGITPHHTLLNEDMMLDERGLLLMMNPPLRPKKMQEYMLKALLDGRIDWIETDHAPHTLKDKKEKYLSGIPVLHFYQSFIDILKRRGASDRLISSITHKNIEDVFNIEISRKKRRSLSRDELSAEYEFDPFSGF